MFYWLLGLVNLTRAISNKACRNSSVFEPHPFYGKFLGWHRLLAFAWSWKSSRENTNLFSIFLLHFSHFFSLLAFFLLNEQRIQLCKATFYNFRRHLMKYIAMADDIFFNTLETWVHTIFIKIRKLILS